VNPNRRAFGVHVGIANLLIVNAGVSLFAGMMPVPGGIGVAEAGYVPALTAIGVASPVARRERRSTAWRATPWPIPGFFSLRRLGTHGYV